MSAETIPFDRIDVFLRVLFQQLRDMGGTANGSDVIAAISPKLKLSPHELGRTETGRVRWETHLRFYTTDCVKAGYLIKSEGQWSLTPKGEAALGLPPGELVRTANRLYRAWKKSDRVEGADKDGPTVDELERQTVYEEAKEQARKEIDQRIDQLGPYDFQRLVAELLRAMGYHVPYNAPPGPDGGVDIIAYKDPLGTTVPRIKVQVKHRTSKVVSKDIREMEGLLRKEGDIGLIVSSGGFTTDADRELRSSSRHIETMNLDRLITLWQQHYDRLTESGKALLPLVPVFFLAPSEK